MTMTSLRSGVTLGMRRTCPRPPTSDSFRRAADLTADADLSALGSVSTQGNNSSSSGCRRAANSALVDPTRSRMFRLPDVILKSTRFLDGFRPCRAWAISDGGHRQPHLTGW
jgi:hypothetical protein